MAVRELGRARDRAAVNSLAAAFDVARERAEVGAECRRLFPVEVGCGRGQDVARGVLTHEQHVEDAHDSFLLEAVELREDLSLEPAARERDHEKLDRARALDCLKLI